jgi:hypothetical protein
MTKGRAVLPATGVAEQDPFFIALGGPKAHDSSGRDDNSVGPRNLTPLAFVIPTGAQWRDLWFYHGSTRKDA